jgi:hypothetical protein
MSHLPAWLNVVRTLSGHGELDTDGTSAEGQAICTRCYTWYCINGELPSEEVIKKAGGSSGRA